jgi:hypothetical protein
MGLYGKGMLITLTETDPSDEADFNEWYNREHLDERVWMPGFHRARRYVDPDGSAPVKYIATYETDVAEDLSRPAYMELLKDQTDWSKKVMNTFTSFERFTLRITVDQTRGFTGTLGVARFTPPVKHHQALRAHLADTVLPALIATEAMVGACLGENDLEVVNEGRKAQGIAAPENEIPEWIILVDGTTIENTRAVLQSTFGDELEGFGISSDKIRCNTYGLMFGNNR